MFSKGRATYDPSVGDCDQGLLNFQGHMGLLYRCKFLRGIDRVASTFSLGRDSVAKTARWAPPSPESPCPSSEVQRRFLRSDVFDRKGPKRAAAPFHLQTSEIPSRPIRRVGMH